MPTPSGERSVQDAIDNGKQFVTASGIAHELQHKCATSLTNCTCGLNNTLARLALEMDDALQKYPLQVVETPVEEVRCRWCNQLIEKTPKENRQFGWPDWTHVGGLFSCLKSLDLKATPPKGGRE